MLIFEFFIFFSLHRIQMFPDKLQIHFFDLKYLRLLSCFDENASVNFCFYYLGLKLIMTCIKHFLNSRESNIFGVQNSALPTSRRTTKQIFWNFDRVLGASQSPARSQNTKFYSMLIKINSLLDNN